jgi:peptidyl-Lys metalloendopeptidase
MVDNADDQTVYLGNAFANSPMTGANSAPGVLAHEMSHFDSIGATDDVEDAEGVTVYGEDRSAKLAEDDPDSALKNADNFEFFVEDGP